MKRLPRQSEVCLSCGDPTPDGRSNTLYCSGKCRLRAFKAKRRTRPVRKPETDADLDSLVAEQMKNLPPWWNQ